MAWRGERSRYIFRYQDQEFGIRRLSGLAAGMAILAAIVVLDSVLDIGIFDLPFWGYGLVVMLPIGAIAMIGGPKLQRLFAVHDVRAASRHAKIGFVLLAIAVCVASMVVMLIALN